MSNPFLRIQSPRWQGVAPWATKDCGVPQEVCEGFDFASARKEIKKWCGEKVESDSALLEAPNEDVGTLKGEIRTFLHGMKVSPTYSQVFV